MEQPEERWLIASSLLRPVVVYMAIVEENVVKKSNPIGLDRPGGFQEVEALRFQDIRHIKVESLSALRTDRLYPTKYCWYSFLLEADSAPGS